MPPSLDQVHEEAVEQYFSKIDDPQWEELNLPPRHSHGRNIESKLWLKSSWATSWTEPRWWPKQHIISSLESLCRLQTTDEIKVNMPYRSPFITVETLCCLFVKLYPFYNNYSRLVAAMISSVLVTAHDLCMRNQGLCHSSVIVLSSEFSSDALTRLSKMGWYSPTRQHFALDGPLCSSWAKIGSLGLVWTIWSARLGPIWNWNAQT